MTRLTFSISLFVLFVVLVFLLLPSTDNQKKDFPQGRVRGFRNPLLLKCGAVPRYNVDIQQFLALPPSWDNTANIARCLSFSFSGSLALLTDFLFFALKLRLSPVCVTGIQKQKHVCPILTSDWSIIIIMGFFFPNTYTDTPYKRPRVLFSYTNMHLNWRLYSG